MFRSDIAMNQIPYVYCAGPQYSPEESQSMLQIASLLEKSGFKTYLSVRDGLEYTILSLKTNPDLAQAEWHDLLEAMNKIVFAMEIFQVTRRCGFLVLNLNGRVPDEGSVFKASVAFSAGKPVVIYKNDHRSVFNGHDNTMVTGLSGGVPLVKKLSRIPKALIHAIEKDKSDDSLFYRGDKIPLYVRRVVDFGEEVWGLFNEMDLSNTDTNYIYPQLLRLKSRCEKAKGMKHLQI